jgi:hypothetical protein
MPSGEQVLDPDLGPDDRLPQVLFAHGDPGRASRTAPTTNSSGMIRPKSPVQTLPLSSVTDASRNRAASTRCSVVTAPGLPGSSRW